MRRLAENKLGHWQPRSVLLLANLVEGSPVVFVTPELIRAFCIAGQPDEIIEQLLSLEGEGLDGISFIPPVDDRHSMHAAFAKEVIARMR